MDQETDVIYNMCVVWKFEANWKSVVWCLVFSHHAESSENIACNRTYVTCQLKDKVKCVYCSHVCCADVQSRNTPTSFTQSRGKNVACGQLLLVVNQTEWPWSPFSVLMMLRLSAMLWPRLPAHSTHTTPPLWHGTAAVILKQLL